MNTRERTTVLQTLWDRFLANDPSLDLDHFVTTILDCYRRDLIKAADVGAVSERFFTSPSDKTARCGRWLLEKIGVNTHPLIAFYYSVDLVQGRGGAVDIAQGNDRLSRLLSDSSLTTSQRAIALSILADSYRYGRGFQADEARSLAFYEEAARLGDATSALKAGMYWEGKWGAMLPIHAGPNYDRAASFYEMAADTLPACARNLAALHLGLKVSQPDRAKAEALLKSSEAPGVTAAPDTKRWSH